MSAEQYAPRYRNAQVDDEFERWTVIGPAVQKPSKKDPSLFFVFHLCECRCGTVREVIRGNLIRGLSSSCGCLHKERASKANKRHGETRTRLHSIWRGINARCESLGDQAYGNYGGRGIRVCPEWRQSYETFRDWARSHGYTADLTIERIEVDGNYCPENCEWIPLAQQSLNRRSTRYVTAFGETKPLTVWVQDPRCVVGRDTLKQRLNKRWEAEEAISSPPDMCRPKHLNKTA